MINTKLVKQKNIVNTFNDSIRRMTMEGNKKPLTEGSVKDYPKGTFRDHPTKQRPISPPPPPMPKPPPPTQEPTRDNDTR